MRLVWEFGILVLVFLADGMALGLRIVQSDGFSTLLSRFVLTMPTEQRALSHRNWNRHE